MLCRRWGFYFVAAQSDGIGARDLEYMIDGLESTPGWIQNIFEDSSPGSVSYNNQSNTRIAFDRITMVLLARWAIFGTFVQVAKNLNDGCLPESIKYDWLLFQVLDFGSFKINDKIHTNPFLTLIQMCLTGVGSNTLRWLMEDCHPGNILGEDFDSTHEKFLYVLDEAQVARNQYGSSFSDADGQIKQPILGPIIQCLTYMQAPFTQVVVSGTSSSPDLFKRVLTSSVGKLGTGVKVEHRTGDFTNRSVQQAYISRYIPPSFLLSRSGAALLILIYEWLRGRYAISLALG
jgi:hypothetical protein